jgi:hypothetical protein
MPSPFPGMDPYLEGSEWMSVHTQLSVEIARQLSPQLRPRYVARTPKRYVVAMPDADDDVAVSTANLYPDVSVEVGAAPSVTNATRVAVMEAPLLLAVAMPESIPLITVEIRATANQQLVTAIEVLSPTNKRGDGRAEYLERRRRFLLSSTHLMEIDLLRRGARRPMRKPLPARPYFVILSPAGQRPVAQVWPIKLAQPLPTVPVPLLPGDGEVLLDLQKALTTVYDSFSYDISLNYQYPPEIPLPAKDAAWAHKWLNKWRTAQKSPGS